LLSFPLRIGVRVWFGISIPIVPCENSSTAASRSRAFLGLPPQIALALKTKINPEFVHIKLKRKEGLM
jgi:hypothetical protein